MVKETVPKKGSWGCLGVLVAGLVAVPIALSGLHYGISNKAKMEFGGSYSRTISWSLVDLPYGRTSFERTNKCITLRQSPQYFVGSFYEEKHCKGDGRLISPRFQKQLKRFEQEFKKDF